MLTGESVPADVTTGDQVTGATLNTSGRIIVEATRVGADTRLARMAQLVMPHQTNHLGTLFGGVALGFMDQAAFVAASRLARARRSRGSAPRRCRRPP